MILFDAWSLGYASKHFKARLEASNKSMWLYAHSHVNYLVNFTSDLIRCLAFPGGREARDSEPDRRARRGAEVQS